MVSRHTCWRYFTLNLQMRWRALQEGKVYVKQIHISNKKTTTSKDTKEAYYLSITDIIWQALNNPLLFNQMYFGPGQKVAKNQELWHGDIWKESPRFGHASIQINEGMLSVFAKIMVIKGFIIITSDVLLWRFRSL